MKIDKELYEKIDSVRKTNIEAFDWIDGRGSKHKKVKGSGFTISHKGKNYRFPGNLQLGNGKLCVDNLLNEVDLEFFSYCKENKILRPHASDWTNYVISLQKTKDYDTIHIQ